VEEKHTVVFFQKLMAKIRNTLPSNQTERMKSAFAWDRLGLLRHGIPMHKCRQFQK